MTIERQADNPVVPGEFYPPKTQRPAVPGRMAARFDLAVEMHRTSPVPADDQIWSELATLIQNEKGERAIRAFEAIYSRFAEPTTSFLRYSFGLRPEDAEELTQDILIKVLRGLPRTQGSVDFWPWFKTVTIRTAIDHYRHRALVRWFSVEKTAFRIDQLMQHAGGVNPEEHAIAQEAIQWLEKHSKDLPDRQRQALILWITQRYEYVEIANIMGTTESAVKTLIWRARKDLSNKWPDTETAIVERSKRKYA
ncbi:MAG: hypothetical protein A2700_02125 [Candidatus Blackburnbacteria bacterium RIFCSPHIGHO2_01_FULL_44_64]|uniref:RNA polymerase sigma factor 70 region 4 type 2 domain-containing protein n=1 Tax=Candidatus Blackburnbacteria bacterium RIFCSPHIGHO2_02_FULL_44_20 TaxID=1797516 RepID=A0A1G1V852_9BACT|nr:MAG: hypothetical protein A2700_02125 [Candidatus Blackburnbacteria bacterium RIFCSPHIGHO2_01_FULL_44_64]OGY11200.1 MAG: hypothetical protein A3E16_00355 [Candidatus Blackburnbacteria bacterium RIFCSPHIGHO2_12_FULL_44_25]OGY11487.1 MAG: hypothetical protein A3D26_04665 [Candidatus Blackburnbacteria bacterium RIFCSPHIGHO2_02_FULL_44_20]OGY15170.1 MAG: hypothetical protein A3A62_01420 [Candidatus Blackburnbacteria bacterium RIFCSPLOWO2_01_FULL_44_43]OGY17554.1 MAG: hypothetical protein A3H88_0